MDLHLPVLLLAIACLIAPAAAVEFRSADEVVVGQPIDDDLFASGGSISVNAPVQSLTAAGGAITVSAPVQGDVIAAGGRIEIRAPVGGKVIAAGGEVVIDDQVATNAVVTAGQVTIGENGFIGRDAVISAGEVQNAGTVAGDLVVSAGDFENRGSAGTVRYEPVERDTGIDFPIFGLIMTVGFLIAGLLLIRFLPGPFTAVSDAIRDDPVKAALLGVGAGLVSALLILLLAVSIIGIPVALIVTLVLAVVILLSNLFVSAWIGDLVAGRLHIATSDYGAFVIGFVILHLLFFIPVLGALVRIVAWAAGTGAVVLALRTVAKSGG